MPLLFARLPPTISGSRAKLEPVPSTQCHATDTAQGSSCSTSAASPLVFPRYLDGRDISACVFSLSRVDVHWLDALLRRLRPRHHLMLPGQPHQGCLSADVTPSDASVRSCAPGGEKSDHHFSALSVSIRLRRSDPSLLTAYTQRVMNDSPSPLRISEDIKGNSSQYGIGLCGLRLVWPRVPPNARQHVSPAALGTMRKAGEECAHTRATGSAAADDATAYPTPFRVVCILDGNAGGGKAVTADVCGAAACAHLWANTGPSVFPADHPPSTHADNLGPLLTSVHQPLREVHSAEFGGRRCAASPSLLPSSVFLPQEKHEWRAVQGALPQHLDYSVRKSRRLGIEVGGYSPHPCLRMSAELPDALLFGPNSHHVVEDPPLLLPPSESLSQSRSVCKWTRTALKLSADFILSSCSTAAILEETPRPLHAALGLCDALARTALLHALATPKIFLKAAGASSASGLLPQRHFTEVESLQHFPPTAPSVVHPLRTPEDAQPKMIWCVILRQAAWVQDTEKISDGGQMSAGDMGCSLGTTLVPHKTAVVRHTRLRCLVRDVRRDGDDVIRFGPSIASEAPPAAQVMSIKGGFSAAALSAQWASFIADVHELDSAREQQRAIVTYERCQAAVASLGNTGEGVVAAMLTSLRQSYSQCTDTVRGVTDHRNKRRMPSALDAGPVVSSPLFSQDYPYPVLEWWRCTSCTGTDVPPPQYSRKRLHSQLEMGFPFHKAHGGAKATGEDPVLALLHWVRAVSDARWRAASWLPWDSWIAAVRAVAGVPNFSFLIVPRPAMLLMPSGNRLRSDARMTATGDEEAPVLRSAPHSPVFVCFHTWRPSTDSPLERRLWSALGAAPQLLSETKLSEVSELIGLRAAVPREGASSAEPQHCGLRAAAVVECEYLARVCAQHARGLSRKRRADDDAIATRMPESSAHSLRHPSLKRRRLGGTVAVATSSHDDGQPKRRTAEWLGVSSACVSESASRCTRSPSPAEVTYVSRHQANVASVELLGEHSCSTPATRPSLKPPESSSVSEDLSIESGSADDLRVCRTVHNKRARLAVSSPSSSVLPHSPPAVTSSLTSSARSSSPQLQKELSMLFQSSIARAQRCSTPLRLLTASLEHRCCELTSVRCHSLPPTASPSDMSQATKLCLDSDKLERMRRWLLSPPCPTRLPAALSPQWRQRAAVSRESASSASPVKPVSLAHAPFVSRESCLPQRLIEEARSAILHAFLDVPWTQVSEVGGEGMGGGAPAATTTCGDDNLRHTAVGMTTTTTTTDSGGSSVGCASVSLRHPAMLFCGQRPAPMNSTVVWRWAQLALHNFAADALVGAILYDRCACESSLRRAEAVTQPSAQTAAPATKSERRPFLESQTNNPPANLLTRSFPLHVPPPFSISRDEPSLVIGTTRSTLLMTVEHWRQRRGRGAAQRIGFYQSVATATRPPTPSVSPSLHSLFNTLEVEQITSLHGASRVANDTTSRACGTGGRWKIGPHVHYDRPEPERVLALAHSLRTALVDAQYTACMRTLHRLGARGEDGVDHVAQAPQVSDICMPRRVADNRRCVAHKRALHHLICDGMLRDGWLLFFTHWHHAVSADWPGTWPVCLSNTIQGCEVAGTASDEGDGSSNGSTHGFSSRGACSQQARLRQSTIESDVRVDTEPRAGPLEASAQEMLWYMDTSDEEDEWLSSERNENESAVLREHRSSNWCCCCLAADANLCDVEAPQRVGAAPTRCRLASCSSSEAPPLLCPAWWRRNVKVGATSVCNRASFAQPSSICGGVPSNDKRNAVRYACRYLYYYHDHYPGTGHEVSTSVLLPRPPSSSPESLPDWGETCRNGLDAVAIPVSAADGVDASEAIARSFLGRMRRYIAQLLSREPLIAPSAQVVPEEPCTGWRHHRPPPSSRSGAASPDSSQCWPCSLGVSLSPSLPRSPSSRAKVVAAAAAAPSLQKQSEDEEDIEEQAAPLRCHRYTRHVCTPWEEAQSVLTWLMPQWWKRQLQRLAATTGAPLPPPGSRGSDDVEHPPDKSHETVLTGAQSAADGRGYIDRVDPEAPVPGYLGQREELELWVQLLHHAYLRQLRRPYGPLFHGEHLQLCAPLDGCEVDAEVHHTYLVALLQQRAEASLCTRVRRSPEPHKD